MTTLRNPSQKMEQGEWDYLFVQVVGMGTTILSYCNCPVVITKLRQGKEEYITVSRNECRSYKISAEIVHPLHVEGCV